MSYFSQYLISYRPKWVFWTGLWAQWYRFPEQSGCWDSHPVERNGNGAGTRAAATGLHWDWTKSEPTALLWHSVQEAEGTADNTLHMGHHHPSSSN